jgi:hypothetical protein
MVYFFCFKKYLYIINLKKIVSLQNIFNLKKLILI